MKINLAVLFGGNSVEHEVSIISALQAIQSLNKDKYEILPVYITKTSEFYTGEKLLEIKNFTKIPQLLAECRRVTFLNRDGRTYLVTDENKLFGKRTETVIDIALQCGFNDSSYFVSVFKKYKHVTPLQYRHNAYQAEIG